MTDDLRVQIRHLYFVDRIALRDIAELLTLSPQAVRSALLLPGGEVAPTTPTPVALALDQPVPAATPLIRAAVSRAVSAFRRATQRRR